MIRTVLAALGVLALIAVSAIGAKAYDDYYADQDAPAQIRVSTRDLDLTRPDDLEELENRIDLAVDRVCDLDATRGLSSRRERDCRENAYAGTRRQIASAVRRARREGYAMRRDTAPAYRPGEAVGGPAYREPMAPPSGYHQPLYREPGYGQPVRYQEPLYRAPAYREPAAYGPYRDKPFHAPAPAYAKPAYREPSGDPRYAPYRGPQPVTPRWIAPQPRLGELGDDLARQPGGVRRSVERALVLAFERGDAAQWRSWGARGYVTVSDGRRFRGSVCRNVAVVHAIVGGYETIAGGLRCQGRDGAFDAPWS